MKVVVDTNVFISGVFFTGPPHQILDAWRRGSVHIVVAPEILIEYYDTSAELTAHFPDVELEPWLELLADLAKQMALPTETTDLISLWVKDYGALLERFDALVSE